MSKPADFETWRPLAGTAEIPALSLDMRLELTPHIKITRDHGMITRIEFAARRVSFGESQREWVTRVIEAAPTHTIREVAEHTGVDEDLVLDLLQQLYQFGVMQNAGDTLVPGPAFKEHIDGFTLTFQIRIGELFAQTLADAHSRRMVLGKFIEEYHFILANAEHVAPAIMHAANPRLRMMWCDYLSDEYWHGLWIRKGIIAAGITDEQLDRADPLPGTHAVIRHLQWTAGTDPLAYAACLGSGESLGVDAEAAKRHYDAILASGHVSEEVLAPFREHHILDLEAGHLSFSSEVFAEAPPLSRQQQDHVRRAVLMYHHVLFEQQLQILRYYQQEDAPLPFTVEQLPRLVELPFATQLRALA